MKLIKINPDYNSTFFDDGGMILFDGYAEYAVHLNEDGDAMILSPREAEIFREKCEEIESFWDETCPLIFTDYDPGGEHLTLEEIRRRES